MDLFEIPDLSGVEDRLYNILNTYGDSLDPVRAKMQELTRQELDKRMMRVSIAVQTAQETGVRAQRKHRVLLWLLSQEYTRRGVPPVLQHLPEPSDDDSEQIADATMIDLHWVRTRYPKHKAFFTGWNVVFAPTTFGSKSWWIGNHYPKRKPIDWICRGLSLSDQQQRELHFIKKHGLRNQHERLLAQREDVWHQLDYEYGRRDKRYQTKDRKATIDRRCAIWYVGHLAEWSPQRTAFLYEAHTGEPMTRQLAANTIEKVHRDVPTSKPRHTAKTPKDKYSKE